ncbi:MAG: 4-(cytidine 5'-diphospho)-2-C-methyl-D-erythritol kinase [Candidatus Methylomirabilales bacterium]
MALTLWAPAKVNLFLEVLRKRADGYHEVRTVLQHVDLCDEIRICKAGGGIAVESHGLPCPGGEENLAYRAAALFLKSTGLRAGVRIQIVKRIPLGAGLGGGSSNAATTLWGLNRLFGTGLTVEGLHRLGAALGSDVPLFFGGPTAWASGRGEDLHPLPPFPRSWLLIAFPDIPVPTAWAYANLELTGSDKSIRVRAAVEHGDYELVLAAPWNRFEDVVFRRYPAVKQLKVSLEAWGARPALMTGSGSAVFGRAEAREEAEGWAARLRERGTTVFVVQTLSRPPLGPGGIGEVGPERSSR